MRTLAHRSTSASVLAPLPCRWRPCLAAGGHVRALPGCRCLAAPESPTLPLPFSIRRRLPYGTCVAARPLLSPANPDNR